MIVVGARASLLSRKQVDEVLHELHAFHPTITFEPIFLESTGDRDLATSLRTLNKTDFFTKEIDQLLLQGKCSLAIHSAKDLPDPLPQGLKMVALTHGVDPTDSLVMRSEDSFDTLPSGALIATSSDRREATVRSLRPDLTFRDLRGAIQTRLQLLEKGEADGVVVAEAALIRLGLTHLNRLRLPGATTPLQGQLAILSRGGDAEMEKLFKPLDCRALPQALYLGPELPLKAFRERRLIHCPLIDVAYRPSCDPGIAKMLQEWPRFSHLILTSKTAARGILQLLKHYKLSLQDKTLLTVGAATQELLLQHGFPSLVAKNESAEGIIELIDTLTLTNLSFGFSSIEIQRDSGSDGDFFVEINSLRPIDEAKKLARWPEDPVFQREKPKTQVTKAYLLWPHSSLSRPLIQDELLKREIPFLAPILYDTYTLPGASLPDLTAFDEVLFSSPSTVTAFFSLNPTLPPHLKLTPIGPITKESLALLWLT